MKTYQFILGPSSFLQCKQCGNLYAMPAEREVKAEQPTETMWDQQPPPPPKKVNLFNSGCLFCLIFDGCKQYLN